MEALWNTMISYLMTSLPTKGFEPGSMEYSSIFPTFNSLKDASFRNIILQSFDSFNNGHFFLLMQIALCIYCPTLALAIIYQQYDLEQEQPQQDQQFSQHICQTQTQTQKQQFVIRQLSQLIQSLFQIPQTQIQCQMQQQMQQMQQQQQFMQQLCQLCQLKQIKQKTIISTQNVYGGRNVKITVILGEAGQVYVHIEERQVLEKIIKF